LGAIGHTTDGALGLITLDDPAGGNRLNPDTLEALLDAVRRHVADPAVRAVLLRSGGEAFCLGMDLARLAQAHGPERSRAIEDAVATYVKVLETIHEAPKPFVAAVDGDVKAGGVGLVCCCDAVIASEESTFELGEAFFGIIPANVLPFLLGLRMPLQRVRYLILTARTLGAREAAVFGLADEVYSSADLERGVRELLKRMWRIAPAAAAEGKAFTRALLGVEPGAAREMGRRKLSELLARSEVMETIRSFDEGSVPPWFARFRPSAPLVRPGGDKGRSDPGGTG
jgi:enoyl-CoA hydratase/carnithine racemase